MSSIRLCFSLAALAITMTCVTPAVLAASTADERRDKIRGMREAVLADLYKEKPDLKAKIKKAAGYAVFSNVGVNLILASFAGGHGVLVDKKGHETFMKWVPPGLVSGSA